jgi:hypothetical protein
VSDDRTPEEQLAAAARELAAAVHAHIDELATSLHELRTLGKW